MSILFEALIAKFPGVDFSVTNSEVEWRSTAVPQPSSEEIDAIVEEFKRTSPPEEELGLGYDQLRRLKYPSIEEQLDIIYHKGIQEWKEAIQEIKTRYPKPDIIKISATPSSGDIPVTKV
jgi:hypothetical protein